MSSSLICKLSYGDETRRFTVLTEDVTYSALHTRAEALFNFKPDTNFKLQYKDDEGDVITMSTDDEMAEAVGLAVSFTPPILRISVKMDTPSPPPAAAPPTAAPPAAAPPAPAAEGTGAAAPDFASLLKNINEQLPKVVGKGADGAPPDLSALFKTVGDVLPHFVESLPECVRAHIPNAELDLAATMASNTASNVASAFGANGGKCPGVSFSVLPPRGYGDEGVHPGVTCDKTGMSPIVGPRYNLKGHDYDLCEAEFKKLDPTEQAQFVKIDPPFGHAMPHAAAVHHGVTCDKTGMNPIVGPRYNLTGHNYDLCEAEFNKLNPAEQAGFVKIAAPWKRPKCMWGRGHHNPNNPKNNNGGCHGASKLAARFVSDVSIFDGTQMAPGTAFTKIWRIKNVGDMPWPAGTKLLFVGGDRMAAELTVPLGEHNKVVMPGEEVDVAVDMVAPTELGRYLGYWRLVGPLGRRRFGQRVWCHIQVVDPAGSVAPHDPNAVAAEICNLMAKVEKECDPEDADDGELEACSMAPAATTTSAPAAEAPPVAAPVALADTASVASSSVSNLSSAVSSATSSAVSVHKEEASTDAVAPLAAPTDAEAPKEAPEKESKATSTKEEATDDVTDVATQLMQMGFEPKSVELVMKKNAALAPDWSRLLETCSRDLLQLSEWDSMLVDLEEMGFEDREKNTLLILKHDGSVKRTVKDLVAENM